MLEAVLFDLDGTLLDNSLRHTVCWERVAQALCLADAPYLPMFHGGLTSQALVTHLFPTLGEYARDLAISLKKYHYDRCGAETTAVGAHELLQVLRDAGIRVQIVTGASEERALRAGKLFGIPARDIFAGRHKEDGYACALLSLIASGIAVDSCLAVEDSRPGVAAALSVGLRVVGVSRIRHDDTFWLRKAGAHATYPGLHMLTVSKLQAIRDSDGH